MCTKHGQVGSSPLCTQPSSKVGLSVADGCGTSQGFWFFNSLREKESTPPSSYKGLSQGEQEKRLWLLSEEVNCSKIHGTTHNSGSHTHTETKAQHFSQLDATRKLNGNTAAITNANQTRLNDTSHFRNVHILYALWCKLHLVETKCTNRWSSKHRNEQGRQHPCKPGPTSEGASDVSVTTVSVSTKYAWVCFLEEHEGIFPTSSGNIYWAGDPVKCLQEAL